MALTTKDELLLVWRSLAHTEGSDGWRRIGIDTINNTHIMAGVCHPGGREAVLISFTGLSIAKLINLPQSRGFKVSNEMFEADSRTWITLTRSAQGPFDLFSLMAVDVINNLKTFKDETDATRYQNLLGRIKAWQNFMKPGRDGLTLEEELGLAGELIVLGELISSGIDIDTALDFWTGPEDGLQDFEIGTGAIEVKSTLAEIGFPAKIQSIDQLDDSQRKPLFVAGCRFGVSETGETLPNIIKSIENIMFKDLGKLQALEIKLIGVGYHHSHSERYIRKLKKLDLYLWLVDSSFPRLIASNVPSGIRSVNYTIDLEPESSNIGSLSTALTMLKGA